MGSTWFYKKECSGCGIRLSDGYCIDCETCQDRRRNRLQKGQIYSPTGNAGEMIDNRVPAGRLVAA